MGPLHDPVRWYGINYVGKQNKGKLGSGLVRVHHVAGSCKGPIQQMLSNLSVIVVDCDNYMHLLFLVG